MEKRAKQVEEIHVCVCEEAGERKKSSVYSGSTAKQEPEPGPFPAHNHVDCLKAQLHVLSAEV